MLERKQVHPYSSTNIDGRREMGDINPIFGHYAERIYGASAIKRFHARE